MEDNKLEEKELTRRRTQLYERSHKIRGSIIDQTIFIERFLENIISWHFCPDAKKHDQFFELILNHIDLRFSSKIEIFQKVMKQCYPDLLKKHSDLIKRLHRVRKMRNELAHSMLDNSEKFLSKNHKDIIQLRFFENGRTKQRIITEDLFIEEMKNCERILTFLYDFYGEVKQQTKRKQT